MNAMIPLVIVTAVLAVTGRVLGLASTLESISFVTGAICVWLTVRENVWNFPIGALNVITFFFVFYDAKLFADAGLQIVYLILALIGWYRWLYGGANRTELAITRATGQELAVALAAGAAATVLFWRVVSHFGGSSSFWDALTTAGSLVAQWFTNGKKLESWHVWIAVDVVYVPLYVSKGLYLTAVLYAVFLTMAVMGLRAWQQKRLAA